MAVTEFKLKIDLDLPNSIPHSFLLLQKFARRLRRLSTDCSVDLSSLRIFVTNKGLHIYITVSCNIKMSEREKLMFTLILQSFLLDDSGRSYANLMRLLGKRRGRFNLMFKCKNKYTLENGKVKHEVIHCEKRNRLLERYILYIAFRIPYSPNKPKVL